MLAAVGLGWERSLSQPRWTCAVYLTLPGIGTLTLDGHGINFGFEVVTSDPADPPTALAERVDERLVTCRRRARVVAGHNLGPALDHLDHIAGTRRLPGVDSMRRHWADRSTKGRGTATMVDTAYDVGSACRSAAGAGDARDAADLAAVCRHVDLTTGPDSGVYRSDPSSDANADPAGIARGALSQTLAVALVAARHVGQYRWTSPVDIDDAVTRAAWDLLGELGGKPSC